MLLNSYLLTIKLAPPLISSQSKGKCKTWTLDWNGLMDWTNGLKFGLTIKTENQLVGSNRVGRHSQMKTLSNCYMTNCVCKVNSMVLQPIEALYSLAQTLVIVAICTIDRTDRPSN